MKILVVTKDMASVNGMLPIVKARKDLGDEIVLVTEGLSNDIWLENGFEPVFKGSKDFKKEPFECDVQELINHAKPDVVATGFGNPINIERGFALAANAAGIPTVGYEDLWEGHQRTPACYDTILTLDDVAERVIRSKQQFADTRVIKIGNASVLEGAKTPVKAETMATVDKLRKDGSLVVLMAGAGGYTTDMLRVTFQSVLMTRTRVKLIVRLHPKYFPMLAVDGDGKITNGELWKMRVATFQERNPDVLVELDGKQHKTDDLARCCDIVISTAGTALLNAAVARMVPISVMTEITAEGLRELMPSLAHYPLVDAGAVVEIKEPIDLGALIMLKHKGMWIAQKTYFETWDGGLERAVAAFDRFRR